MHELLHRLWTKAVGTEGYNKGEWERLEAMLPLAKPKDWRIGLSCKPVHRTHQMYYETCHVVDVFPSGTAGIVDPNGVLMIKAVTGRVFLEGASLWTTT